MPARSRFDAETIETLATRNETGRFEIMLRDSEGGTHIVSLPLPAAVALGCLICDVSEKASFLLGDKSPSTPKPILRRGMQKWPR